VIGTSQPVAGGKERGVWVRILHGAAYTVGRKAEQRGVKLAKSENQSRLQARRGGEYRVGKRKDYERENRKTSSRDCCLF